MFGPQGLTLGVASAHVSPRGDTIHFQSDLGVKYERHIIYSGRVHLGWSFILLGSVIFLI